MRDAAAVGPHGTRVLRREPSLSAVELAVAARGLRGWADAHGNGYRAIDVAISIATGDTAYEIVRRISGTRRTSEQVKAVHAVWRSRQLRNARA